MQRPVAAVSPLSCKEAAVALQPLSALYAQKILGRIPCVVLAAACQGSGEGSLVTWAKAASICLPSLHPCVQVVEQSLAQAEPRNPALQGVAGYICCRLVFHAAFVDRPPMVPGSRQQIRSWKLLAERLRGLLSAAACGGGIGPSQASECHSAIGRFEWLQSVPEVAMLRIHQKAPFRFLLVRGTMRPAALPSVVPDAGDAACVVLDESTYGLTRLKALAGALGCGFASAVSRDPGHRQSGAWSSPVLVSKSGELFSATAPVPGPEKDANGDDALLAFGVELLGQIVAQMEAVGVLEARNAFSDLLALIRDRSLEAALEDRLFAVQMVSWRDVMAVFGGALRTAELLVGSDMICHAAGDEG